MTVTITKSHIPAGTAARPGYSMTPIGVTIHNTGSSASAYNHMLYMTKNGGYNQSTSYHYVIDEKDCYELIPPTENAWHAGDGATGTGNRQTIAIEVCECGDITKAHDRAAELAGMLLKERGLTAQKALFQHATWMAKDCPSLLRAGKPYSWAVFAEKVNQAIKPTTTPVVAPVLKQPEPQLYTVKDASGKVIGTNSDLAKARALCTADCTIYDRSGRVTGTATTATVWRLYNPNGGCHHYTTNPAERDYLAANGWKDEEKAWTSPVTGTPVYRLYSGKEHLLTVSHAEHDQLEKLGWTCEGTGMFSGTGAPVYRVYNPNSGLHHVTASAAEKSSLLKAGWKDEGTAFYTA